MKKIILNLLIIFALAAPLTALADNSLPTIINPFDKLQVKIPGLERFSEPQITEVDGRPVINTNWIGEYIIGIYNYAIGIIGILAVLGMAIGGVMWIMSAGNKTMVGEAKSWITSSLLGLVLALGSYTLLYIINKDLITFRPINTLYIPRKDFYELSKSEQEANAPVSGGFSHNVPWLFQCSPEGKQLMYGNCSPPKSICATGCGLISTLMVLNYYGQNPSLSDWLRVAVDNGARVCGSGSSADGLIAAAKQYGLNGWTISTSDIGSYLDRNQPVIISLKGPCVFTQGGHFVVLTGWRDRNQQLVDVNDAANSDRQENRTWTKLGQWSGCTPNQIFTLSQ